MKKICSLFAALGAISFLACDDIDDDDLVDVDGGNGDAAAETDASADAGTGDAGDAATSTDSGTGDAGEQDATADSSTDDAGDASTDTDGSTDDAGEQDADTDGSTDDAGEQDADTDGSTDDAGDASEPPSCTPEAIVATEKFDLRGQYTTDANEEHVIMNSSWTVKDDNEQNDPEVFRFVKRGENFVIAQNATKTRDHFDKYSRIDWEKVGDDYWFCRIAYDAATAEEAEAVTDADRSDPTTKGCFENPWTKLTPKAACTDDGGNGCAFALAGTYTDDYCSSHIIENDSWTMSFLGYESDASLFTFKKYATNYVIARNTVHSWNQDQFSRFDWVISNGDIWFCQIAYSAATLEEAEAVTTADPTALETNGCNGAPWSKLIPQD